MNINELFTIQNTISVVLLLCTILLVIKLLNTKSEHAKDKEQAIADKTNLEAANQLINSLNAKTQNLEDQISSLQESRTKLIADKNQLSFDNDRLNKESEQLNESIDNYDAQLKQINAENAELRATVEANEKLNAELEKRFEANNNDLKEQMKVIGNTLVKAGTEDLNNSSKSILKSFIFFLLYLYSIGNVIDDNFRTSFSFIVFILLMSDKKYVELDLAKSITSSKLFIK